jgi:hypothetical protein
MISEEMEEAHSESGVFSRCGRGRQTNGIGILSITAKNG